MQDLNKIVNTIFMFFFLLLMSSSACLSFRSNDKYELLIELLKVSGIQNEIDDFIINMDLGIDQIYQNEFSNYFIVDNNKFKAYKLKIVSYYSPINYRQEIIDGLLNSLSIDDVAILVGWFSSPLGEKITKIDENGEKEISYEKKREYLISLEKNRNNHNRIEMIKDILSCLDMAENNSEIYVTFNVAVVSTFLTTFTKSKKITIKNYVRDIIYRKKAIKQAIEERDLLDLAYSLRSLSEDEIQQYLKFNKTDACTKYNNSIKERICRYLVKSNISIYQDHK